MAEQRPVVRIADEADKDGHVHGRVFEDVTIVGPAVLVPEGPVGVEDCVFPGPVERFVWLMPDQAVFGPVGLADVVFRRCTFAPSVGFAADVAFRAAVIGDLLG